MKKGILISTVAFMALAVTGCSNQKQKDDKSVTEYITVNKGDVPSKTIEIKTSEPQIPVGEENFKKLVSYIEKNGFVVPQRGISCDYQYTFFDKNGNPHAMTTIKRDKDGNPSTKGTVDQISVWAYYEGIKDQEHFFGYSITKDRAFPFLTQDEYVEKHIEAVKKGYNDFLEKVNK